MELGEHVGSTDLAGPTSDSHQKRHNFVDCTCCVCMGKSLE